MGIKEELLDELLKNYQKPEDLVGQEGILKQLTKALIERALEGELTHHLGYEKYDGMRKDTSNARNGKGSKTLKTEQGDLEITVPRDREGSFKPQLIKKRQTRFDGFDDKILSMYARGMTTREIQGHLKDMYGVDISPDLVSSVTDSVMEEVKVWQGRALDEIYPIIYMDCLYIKSRDSGQIFNKAVYIAIGVKMDGHKEVLGLWISHNEGAKFWLQVVTELKNRGVKDIFIACVDGLKGFPEAINSIFPHTQVKLCIVHMVRRSLNYVSWKDRKMVAADLRKIYSSATITEAEDALLSFQEKWDAKYLTIGQSWHRNWQGIIPFLAYPAHIRKAIYTTNTVESSNRSLRKIIKNRAEFCKKVCVSRHRNLP